MGQRMRRGVAAATKSVQVLNRLIVSLNPLDKRDGNGSLLIKSVLEGKLM